MQINTANTMTTEFKNTEELIVILTAKLAPFKEWLCNEGSAKQIQDVNQICSIKELSLDFSSFVCAPDRPDSQHGNFMMETYRSLLESYKIALDELKALKLKINLSEISSLPRAYSSIQSCHSDSYRHVIN